MSWEDILKRRPVMPGDTIDAGNEKFIPTLVKYLIEMKGMKTEEEFEEYLGRELRPDDRRIFNSMKYTHDQEWSQNKPPLTHVFNLYEVFTNTFPSLRQVENILGRPLTEKERVTYKAHSKMEYHHENDLREQKRNIERLKNVDDMQ